MQMCRTQHSLHLFPAFRVSPSSLEGDSVVLFCGSMTSEHAQLEDSAFLHVVNHLPQNLCCHGLLCVLCWLVSEASAYLLNIKKFLQCSVGK